jgi:TPP-dependent pyruvate/acetoin dehydrogenase alpha subunit
VAVMTRDSRTLERLYRAVYRIRRTEEAIARIYPTDKIKSPVHLSIGQEAISVAVCEVLAPEDVVFGTYRSHALYLAKGGDLPAMFAELYGKATGCAKGKGGSMHLIDVARGVMGASAVVGSTIPLAVGYAYARKLRRERGIVVSFFGDGATEEGVFAESLNFAGLKRLPLIFVCENNRYAIHAHQRDRQPLDNICDRVRGHGIPAERVDDDVVCLHQRMTEAVEQVRDGSGPIFFECQTYRWMEHVGPGYDFDLGYRGLAEALPWMEGDQCQRLARSLSPDVRRRVETAVEGEIEAAIEFAEASPWPTDVDLYADVFKEASRWTGS